jgi:hypothetical protein
MPRCYPKPELRMRIRIILGSYIRIRIRVEIRIFISFKIQAVEVQKGPSGHRFTSLRSKIPILVKEKSWLRNHQHQSEKADSDSHQGDADPQQS